MTRRQLIALLVILLYFVETGLFRFGYVDPIVGEAIAAEESGKNSSTGNYSSGDSSPQIASSLPKIELSEIEHDFGDVAQGTVLSHDFEIRNSGKAELIIRKLNPSCGCTAAVIEDPVLKPGMKSAIRATFDTTGFVGAKAKTVRVYSNDPHKSSAVLVVRANIVPELLTDPQRLDFGEVRKGSSKDAVFRVKTPINESSGVVNKSARQPAIVVKEVIGKSEHVTAGIQSTDKTTGEVEVVVRLLTDAAPLGRLRSRVVVKTGNPRIPVINVPITADVVGDIRFSPSALNFGYVKGPINEPIIKVITVTRSLDSEEGVALRGVKSSSDAYSVELSKEKQNNLVAETAAGDVTTVIVKLLPGFRGVQRGVITLDILHPDPAQRLVEIPLYAVLDDESK